MGIWDNRRHNLEVVKGWFGRGDRPPDVEQMAQRRDIEGLIRTLSYQDYDLASRAESALSNLGEIAVPSLTAALDADDKAAERAARALCRIEPAGLAAFVARIPRRPIGGGGYWVYPALDSLDDARPALAVILRALRHDEESVRSWADRRVANLDSLDADQALLDALSDPDMYVRVTAARSLVWRKDERGVNVLIEALARRNPPNIRSDSAHVLWRFLGIDSFVSRLKERRDIEGLEAILNHLSLSEDNRRAPRYDPQHAAAEALRDLGDPRAADAFLEVVSAPSYPPRYSESTLGLAVDGLATLRDPRAIDPIKQVYHGHANVYLGWRTVEALREIGGTDAARALGEILATENDKHARIRAIIALDEVIARDMAPHLAELVPTLVGILRDPRSIDVARDLDSDQAWQEESEIETERRARERLSSLLDRLGHVEPTPTPRAEQPVVKRPIDEWSTLADLVKAADPQGLLTLFSEERSWDARETIIVGFREVYRQHSTAGVRRRLKAAVGQALALCRAERSGGSYRANCIQAAQRLLSDLATDT